MWKVWSLVVIAVVYVLTAIYSIRNVLASPGVPALPTIVGFLTGLVPLLISLQSLLLRNNVRIFFMWTRFINQFKNTPTRWNLIVRYDGIFEDGVVEKFVRGFLTESNLRYPTKIHHTTNQSAHFSIDNSLNFFLEFDRRHIFGEEQDVITLKLSDFEIGCRQSEGKLRRQLVPLFTQMEQFFKPEHISYTMSIYFLSRNPFYGVYLDHLDQRSVEDFSVQLIRDDFSVSHIRQDRVAIHKENVTITAQSSNSLQDLAEDFLFLSGDFPKAQATGRG